MNVCVCSLRQGMRWSKPISCIYDAWFFAMQSFFEKRSEYSVSFYNVSWNRERPNRLVDGIRDADVVVLMTSGEWSWQSSVPPLWKKQSDEHITKVLPHLNGKRLIVVSMDCEDTLDLIVDTTLAGASLAKVSLIHENEFPSTIQSLRYSMLKRKPLGFIKDFDFVYWGYPKAKLPGGEKSGDVRSRFVRDVLAECSGYLIGGKMMNRKADVKYNNDLEFLLPVLSRGITTCCFQWPHHAQHLTARYHEAMALGILPFVCDSTYDINRTVSSDWQRVSSAVDLLAKLPEAGQRFNECLELYLDKAPSDASQLRLFNSKFEDALR